MSSTTVAQVLSENFMAERHPINGGVGVKYFRVGAMVDANRDPIPGMEAVVDDVGRGQHWYYCRDDKAVFPCNGSCPVCGRSVRAERPADDLAQDASVRASNALDYG